MMNCRHRIGSVGGLISDPSNGQSVNEDTRTTLFLVAAVALAVASAVHVFDDRLLVGTLTLGSVIVAGVVFLTQR
jgi:hypothetical protein